MARPRVRLALEALDDRCVPAVVEVIPVSQAADNVTTFHRLTNALTAAGPGGEITIRHGATPDGGTQTVAQSGISIQGDPNIPAQALPAYTLTIAVSSVNLTNLNLNTVTVNASFGDLDMTRSRVTGVTITGNTASGNGGNDLTFNTFLGPVVIVGNTAGVTNDVIANNTFASPNVVLLDISLDTGAVIQGNTFQSNVTLAAIRLRGGSNVLVANNTISSRGTSPGTHFGIFVQTAAAASGTIRNNDIATGGGTGMVIDPIGAGPLRYAIEGNDLTDNAVGLWYHGFNATEVSIGSTLGGAAQSGPAVSKGGNIFRTYTTAGTVSSAAIRLGSVGAAAQLNAVGNIFRAGVNPLTASSVEQGLLNVTALAPNPALVTNLYTDNLGRMPSTQDVNDWLAFSTNPNVLANSIARSLESHRETVFGLYRKFLLREPSNDELGFYINNLLTGQSKYEDVLVGFLASPEYLQLNAIDYVQSLYLNLLGRSANGGELAFHYNNMGAAGIAGVARGFVRSFEYRLNTIRSFYQAYFHRTPSNAEILPHVNFGADLFDIKVALFGSQEYFQFR